MERIVNRSVENVALETTKTRMNIGEGASSGTNGSVGGSVWESNPPFDPRRTESPALKAGKVTGLFSPPKEYSLGIVKTRNRRAASEGFPTNSHWANTCLKAIAGRM